MAGTNGSSYGTSWADQWDSGPDPVYHPDLQKTNNGGGAAKYKQKVGDGLGKTKTVALTGMKKVKQGSCVGFHWIKDKYQKTTQKH
ncbi:unnamed protein product [Linum tenue]|uniref:Uncharacterized protein n=1 Tax=Linum tenue TaxID=586396 RepID=A0AAV0INC0_9ROSI|nr:unnamed protein product [Linum tenue]